ncbi:MAG: PAS domain-containing protein [Phycisphaerae bacterium]|nr:PAS domain-containing protein [Phycisphaerae bacterium]
MVPETRAQKMLHLTGHERTFDPGELIVSKTDTKGRITYANQVFQRVAGYTEGELLGKAHSIVRHPDMPRCVFKYLWDTLGAGREVFAYVLNRAKCGDHYWVFAHVTPTFDQRNHIISYHSSRRVPCRRALSAVIPIYQSLLGVEKRFGNPQDQWKASLPVLVETLKQSGMSYDEFIFSITDQGSITDQHSGAAA